jgi:PTH1 family peptidyl-tRNA hydrolase
MLKQYLVTGLGNIGPEYWGTRHNVGFRIVNAVADDTGAIFSDRRYGAIARARVKNAELILLKPNTFMNLSGNAVRYWLQKENIPVENLLIVVDDIALPFGTLRLKPKGSSAGHNGLQHIQDVMCTDGFARLRFGIGNEFSRGRQVDFVLSPFAKDELEKMPDRIKQSVEMVKSFCLSGVDVTMNLYN